MLKKYLLIGLLLSAVHTGQSQLSMTLQVPPAGVLVKNQLWNMLLVNGGDKNMLVRVNLVLLDATTSQPVMAANSAPIVITKGARQLQSKDVAPVQYTFSIPAAGIDMDPNGMLPAGSYLACYTVQNAEKSDVTILENCIALNIDPLSPPLLNTPADGDNLLTKYPQFTWLPPTPVGLFNDLGYSMIVVEVLPGQGSGDAIQQNLPVYTAGYTKDRYVNYPASFRALDTSKLYAWRVVALNNGKAVALSETWTFRVAAARPAVKPKPEEPYLNLKRGQDAAIATGGKVLRLAYENPAADSVLTYTITSLEDAGNPVVQQGQLKLRYGTNLLQVPLQRKNGLVQDKVYLFRFTNSRNENWSIKFMIAD